MIAVIGSNNMDLISYVQRMPEPGETLAMKDFSIAYGGKGANQAVAAARMGADILMLTAVGTDVFGQDIDVHLRAEGIRGDYIKHVDAPNGTASIWVDDTAQNRILIHKGANALLNVQDIERAAEDLRKCSMIILQLEVDYDVVYHAVSFGREHGVPILLNPAPASTELDMARISCCDFFMPNETELEILTNHVVDTMDAIQEAGAILLAQGMKNVIVTLGSKGVLWLHAGGAELIPAFVVEAVDTIGAGDSFIGCFAAVYEREQNVRDALRWANAFAALGVQKRGAQSSYPTRGDVERFITGGGTESLKKLESLIK